VAVRRPRAAVRREFAGQDAGMDIGAILAQAAEEGGAGIARGSDVYIARASVHVTDKVLVRWPQRTSVADGFFGAMLTVPRRP
jgi:hypothetical protein